MGSLEMLWDERAYDVLTEVPGAFDQHTFAKLQSEVSEEFPPMSAAFEDLSTRVSAGSGYFRAHAGTN
jgi:hypothetical protein